MFFSAVSAAKTSGKQEILLQEAAPRGCMDGDQEPVKIRWQDRVFLSHGLGPLWMVCREPLRLSWSLPSCLPAQRAVLDRLSEHHPVAGGPGPSAAQEAGEKAGLYDRTWI